MTMLDMPGLDDQLVLSNTNHGTCDKDVSYFITYELMFVVTLPVGVCPL